MEIQEDHLKIGFNSGKNFTGLLSENEIESCVYEGVLNALKKYDASKSKISTYIHNYVRWQCLKKINKNKKWITYGNMPMIAYHDKEYEEEQYSEILYDRLVYKIPYKELENKYNKTSKELQTWFAKELESFKNNVSYNE